MPLMVILSLQNCDGGFATYSGPAWLEKFNPLVSGIPPSPRQGVPIH